MFNVCNFKFVLVPNTKTKELWFVIRYTDTEYENTTNPKSGIILDTVDVWLDHVKKELDNHKTPEEIITDVRNNIWHNIETDFTNYCNKHNKIIEEDSFQKAIEDYLNTLHSFATLTDFNMPVPTLHNDETIETKRN